MLLGSLFMYVEDGGRNKRRIYILTCLLSNFTQVYLGNIYLQKRHSGKRRNLKYIQMHNYAIVP